MKLSMAEDYQNAADALPEAVEAIYSAYRSRIEGQHRRLEAWMELLQAPAIRATIKV